MGRFSDQVYKRFAGKNKKIQNDVEFTCDKCLKIFNFVYRDIYLKKSGDIEFIPEPSCPGCGSTNDLVFSDYGQEKIEDMLFRGQIKRE
jgi:hypothetical protein